MCELGVVMEYLLIFISVVIVVFGGYIVYQVNKLPNLDEWPNVIDNKFEEGVWDKEQRNGRD